ncbi:hypothetical protein DPMN_058265 [Dreissena polymorpha]|uniref:Uncharacterized protein n=1 Tax=Dreissena polymorpha TaxID=45954 RepID=A0A9D4C1Q0_DREPO|nr:hypothetical protein DPMN_058265 [Dreissena polymorpha]
MWRPVPWKTLLQSLDKNLLQVPKLWALCRVLQNNKTSGTETAADSRTLHTNQSNCVKKPSEPLQIQPLNNTRQQMENASVEIELHILSFHPINNAELLKSLCIEQQHQKGLCLKMCLSKQNPLKVEIKKLESDIQKHVSRLNL